MSTIYSIPYRLWNALPSAFRERLLRWGPVASALHACRKKLMRHGTHNEIYDKKYFELIDSLARDSAEVIASAIEREFDPNFVVDVGCGTGALLTSLQARGIHTTGLEYSDAALQVCRARGLNVRKFNLESDRLDGADTADVVISLEVAEHLPASMADRFVDVLCQSGRVIILTAATPGQGGTDHVNEQPHEYWIEKLVRHSFVYDEPLSERWRRDWRSAGVAHFYAQNIMVFRRQ